MIWLPKKKLVVDCFTHDSTAYELYPVDKSIKFVPDWWRNMPKEYEVRGLFPASTMKRCPAIIESYKHGIILPLWSDLAIKTNGGTDWEIKFSNPHTAMEPHDSKQWDAYANPSDFMHVKLMSPWAFRTKDEVAFMLTKPMWSFPPDNSLVITSGILNFNHQHSTHVNMLIPLKKAPSYVINAGQPMTQLIPLTERQIEIKRHLISYEEFQSKHMNVFSHSFTKSYMKTLAIKKGKKCPF